VEIIAGQIRLLMTAAHWSTTVTAPYYISDDKSDMRGIKRRWYAIEDDGNLSSGPFFSREECVERITQPTNGATACLIAKVPKSRTHNERLSKQRFSLLDQ
jgi:hypothetical protein